MCWSSRTGNYSGKVLKTKTDFRTFIQVGLEMPMPPSAVLIPAATTEKCLLVICAKSLKKDNTLGRSFIDKDDNYKRI